MLQIYESNHCLYCHAYINSSLGWMDLFFPEKKEYLCSACQSQLEQVNGETCRICSRPFQYLEPHFRKGELCFDCFRWEEDSDYHRTLEKNYSLYLYNDFLKELLAKYKYRGDYVLAKIFAEDIKGIVKTIKPNFIIPIPLSTERLQERGFNQAEAIIVEAQLQATHLLSRIHTEKQSKKNRNERIHLPQVFQASQPLNGKILLIDDIYTTGSTLRHAAKTLKQAGAEQVFSLTIARG